MDELLVRAECARDQGPEADAFLARARDGLQTVLGLRVGVELVAARTFERAEHTSRRVVDERSHLRRPHG
jgi:phenylacetate-coenzyme A ligase PaaK-like adenylate-forming protein